MTRLSRRSLLQGSAAAGVAATLTISGTKSSGNVLGANDTVRVGVAGIHGRGNAHISAFTGMEKVEVAYLIDPDSSLHESRAAALAKKTGRRPKCVQDIRKALEDKDLDAVSVATCNHWHSLLTIWACQAGKDVYVEKPCSHNVFEGRQCVEAARKYGRMVQHGTQRRSGNGWETLRSNAEGKKGRLSMVRTTILRPRTAIGFKEPKDPPEKLDFNIWLGPAPRQPYHENLVHYNWHWFWDTGNGDIGNNCVHGVDLARWSIPNATLPRSVVSFGGRFLWKDQGQTPNLLVAVYDFGQTKLIVEAPNLKAKGGRPSTVYDKSHAGEKIEIVAPPDVKNPAGPRGPGGEIFKNFIACVRSRKSQDLDAHILEGHYSSALCHLANISYRLGSEVSFAKQPAELGDDEEVSKSFAWFKQTLVDQGLNLDGATFRQGRLLRFDPAAEKFIGDTEADRLLRREYRPPFVVPEKV